MQHYIFWDLACRFILLNILYDTEFYFSDNTVRIALYYQQYCKVYPWTPLLVWIWNFHRSETMGGTHTQRVTDDFPKGQYQFILPPAIGAFLIPLIPCQYLLFFRFTIFVNHVECKMVSVMIVNCMCQLVCAIPRYLFKHCLCLWRCFWMRLTFKLVKWVNCLRQWG